jgi:predicted flap endonuclease-1-like 5' DNA nuclease
MFLCLLLAAFLGFLIGWFLRAFFCRREQEEQEVAWKVRLEDCHRQLEVVSAEKDEWQSKHEDLQAEVDAATAAVAKSEADWGAKLELAESTSAKARADLEADWSSRFETSQAKSKTSGLELSTALAKVDSLTKSSASATQDLEASWRAKLDGCQGRLRNLGEEKDEWCRKYEAAVAEAASAKAEADEARASAAAAGSTAAQATIIPLVSSGSQDRKDNLKKVEGIGPKIEGLLNADGIWTWAQLAASPVPTLQGVLKAAGERYRIHDPTTWPDQSRLAAEGRWEELQELQDLLKGGRPS